ncbi:Ankyrin repeat containing protein [Spatholobus suberectus]|nr:Ankyrin repeat containing protein [Spatholobus suberectus]
MSAASIASNGIVVEVLNRENYSSWKELVRNYLMGKGLWYNIIVGHDIDKEKEKDPEWESRNRRALHVIQLSCGKAIGQIKNFNEAKKAWDHLKTSFSEDVKAYHAAEAENDEGVGEIPVLLASAKGQKKMTRYLFDPHSLVRLVPKPLEIRCFASFAVHLQRNICFENKGRP